MILRDPVHGLISFSGANEGTIVQLIDSPELQRLRRIRALGLAAFAFPGGEHSRFAHAVGATHVMNRYLDRVARLSDDVPARDRIDEESAAVALAAALLHDLGHGPLSHTFEGVIPNARPHEDWTAQIVLDPDTGVNAVLRARGEEFAQRVAQLIHGQSEVPHLSRAVAGTFDVDRCDYLMRDSHMTGVRYGLLDVDWLLASLRLYVDEEGGPARLAVDGAKGLTAVEGFFLARLYMYQQVYLHKAVRAAEMLMSALFRRLTELGPQPGTPPALRAMLRGEEITTQDYLRLDDHALMQAIAAYATGSDEILRELASRIQDRRLLKTAYLRPDVDSNDALARVRDVLSKRGVAEHLSAVDRVVIDAYVEDESIMVVHSQRRVETLLEASPLLRGLSRESFVHHRAVFPGEHREDVRRALADLT